MTLVDVDREPTEYDIDLSVDVLEPMVTPEHTATLEVRFTNSGADTSPQIVAHRGTTLGPVDDQYDPVSAEVLLVPTELEQPDSRVTCWETPRGFAWDGGAGQSAPSLEPGESFVEEYAVWDPVEDSPCMPTGTYQFGFFHEPSRGNVPFAWMFTLSVEKTE